MPVRAIDADKRIASLHFKIPERYDGLLRSSGPPQPPTQRLHIPRMGVAELPQHSSILGIAFEIFQMQ